MISRIVRKIFGSLSVPPPRRRRAAISAVESVEFRRLLSGGSVSATPFFSDGTISTLSPFAVTETTGEKPQSKLWNYAGHWWNVMPDSTGTWIWKLEGSTWTHNLKLSSSTQFSADTFSHGGVTHVLLCNGSLSQLASVEFVSAGVGSYQFWTQRPGLVNVPLSSSNETATLTVDSANRLWVASDASSTIEVRFSDFPYSTMSGPITIGSCSSDDISAIANLPDGRVGVLWSNQSAKRFQFATHTDGSNPTVWSAIENAASQSALNLGSGMADDHVNLSIASDGTLYAAIKTGYDTSGHTKIGLLVRRPNGVWDPLYKVDTSGTRPIVLLDESINRVMVAYTSSESGGDIVYRESPLDVIAFSSRRTLISGRVNNATSSRQNPTNEILVMAGTGSLAVSALLKLPIVPPPPTNTPPIVNAGADQTIIFPGLANLVGTVVDDGRPNSTLTSAWTKISGPGTVTFSNAASVTTTASFSVVGTYILRLTANDGEFASFDELTVTVSSVGTPNPVTVSFRDGTGGYSGTQDTMLLTSKPNSNNGSNAKLRASGSPDESVLIKWNLSSIPVGSTVTAGWITLYVTNPTGATYELYEVKQNWSESTATWNNYATGSPWATAGAQGSADRGNTVLGVLKTSLTGSTTVTLNAAGVSLLQSWINNPASNLGFAIQDYGASDNVGFYSSEYSTAARRPMLSVSYTLPVSLARVSPALPASVIDPIVQGTRTHESFNVGSELSPANSRTRENPGQGLTPPSTVSIDTRIPGDSRRSPSDLTFPKNGSNTNGGPFVVRRVDLVNPFDRVSESEPMIGVDEDDL